MKYREARKKMQGYWLPAVLCSLIRLGAWFFPLLLEQAFSLFLNVGTESGSVMQGGGHLEDIRLWPYAAVLLWVLLFDLLICSPLRLGQIWFYSRINRGKPADISVLFAPYRHGNYVRSLGWRLRLWGMNGLWGMLFLFPGAIIWACGSWLGNSVSSSLFAAFYSLCGGAALLLGFLALRLWMLRVEPAALLLQDGCPLRSAFRRSKQAMKGSVSDLACLYLRLAGWAASCLLLIPGLYAYPLLQIIRVSYWQERLVAVTLNAPAAAVPVKA